MARSSKLKSVQLSLEQAAAYLGMPAAKVKWARESGKLEAVTDGDSIGRKWHRFTIPALDKFKSEHRAEEAVKQAKKTAMRGRNFAEAPKALERLIEALNDLPRPVNYAEAHKMAEIHRLQIIDLLTENNKLLERLVSGLGA